MADLTNSQHAAHVDVSYAWNERTHDDRRLDLPGAFVQEMFRNRDPLVFSHDHIILGAYPMMTCHDLATRIEELQPEASPSDVARLCLLLTTSTPDLRELEDDECLSIAWKEMGIRLQAATDQHAAMTDELERLADGDPDQFTMDQVWILIRAIKVQSQILQLYVGNPPVDV